MAVRDLAMASYFEELEDPRVARTRKHSLVDLICHSIFAAIASAEGWEEIEEFGCRKESWPRRHLWLAPGTPLHVTISRVFRALKPQAFREWFGVLTERLGLTQIAIDGKTLRRSPDRHSAQNALQLMSTWCVQNQLLLGQQAVDGKSNEVTAIPELLKLLELKGATVTIDAMGCQMEIAEQIVAAKGDFVLSVRDNQPKLHAALQEHFALRAARRRGLRRSASRRRTCSKKWDRR
jgi:hypothetical protein